MLQALRSGAIFIPLFHAIAIRRDKTSTEERFRGVVLKIPGNPCQRLNRRYHSGDLFEFVILANQAQCVLITINAPVRWRGGAVVEIAVAEDLEMASVLNSSGLDPVLDIGDVSAENEHCRDADGNGRQRCERAARVAEDVAKGNL